MQIIKPGTNIDFVGKMQVAVAFSLLLIAATAVLWFTRGPNLGIDFLGGTEVEITFQEDVSIDKVRKALSELELGAVEVKRISGERGVSRTYLIRVEKKELTTKDEGGESVDVADLVTDTLGKKVAPYDKKMLGVSLVGPRAGADLRGEPLSPYFSRWCLCLFISPSGSRCCSASARFWRWLMT